jgi:2'-5' RNA ligase
MAEMPRTRLFIAVETPREIREQVVQIQHNLREAKADVRWEPEEKLHATLKFLGDTPEEDIGSIVEALGTVGSLHPQCEILYTGVGCFPTLRAPRVVWIGIEDPAGSLRSLFMSLEDRMEQLGFARETRAFHPHLTLGRVKGPRNLGGLLARLKTVTFQSEPVIVQEIALVKSDLRSTGSVYTTLNTFPLIV